MDECNDYFTRGVQKDSYLPIMITPGAIEEFVGQPLAKFKQQHKDMHIYVDEATDSE